MFIARIQLQIRDQVAFRAYVTAEIATARALPGCVDYRFCEDVTDASQVLLYEEWTDREAFDAYKASPLFAHANATLKPLLSAPPQSAYYAVTPAAT